MKKYTIIIDSHLESKFKKYANDKLKSDEQTVKLVIELNNPAKVVIVVKESIPKLKSLGVKNPTSWIGIFCNKKPNAEIEKLFNKHLCIDVTGWVSARRIIKGLS